MRKIQKYLFVILILFFIACEKIEDVNPVPSIKFKEFNLEPAYILGNQGWEGTLLFEFNDDDGGDLSDIFQKDSIDTIFSIIFTPFIKVGNDYVYADFDTLNYYLSYKYDENGYEEIKKDGQNKTLKGDWTIKKQYLVKPADTIRYEFYMIDRQGNKSNVEVTSDIGF